MVDDIERRGPGFLRPFGASSDPGVQPDDQRDRADAAVIESTTEILGSPPPTPKSAASSPDELRAEFPPIEVATKVAEAVDDVVPDMKQSDPEALRSALSIIALGYRACTELKALAETGRYTPIARELKAEVRTQKGTIMRLRDEFERVLQSAETEAEAWEAAGVEPPTGFLGMYSSPEDAKRAAANAAKSRKLQQETNDAILAIGRELAEDRRGLLEKRHQEYMRAIRGSRY